MSCNSFNVIYVVICSGCLEEYVLKKQVQALRARNRVRVYRQQRICGGGSFKIFPFLQIRSNDTNIRRAYETKFQREYKSKLNQL